MSQKAYAIRQSIYSQPILGSLGTYPYDAWAAFFERTREGQAFASYAQQDRIPSAERRGYHTCEVEIRLVKEQADADR